MKIIRSKVFHSFLLCFLFFYQAKGQTASQLVTLFGESTNDSVFISKHSFIPYKSYTAQMHSSLHPLGNHLDSVAFKRNAGKVVKCFENDTILVFLKVTRVDSAIKLRVGNIWLDPKGITPDSLIRESEDVLRKAQIGVISFDELCQSYSGTKGQDLTDCDLGWFYPETMVEEFYKASLWHTKGEIYPVETQFGKHIVKTLEDPVKDRWKVSYVLMGIRKKH
jgi:hypothetical protein